MKLRKVLFLATVAALAALPAQAATVHVTTTGTDAPGCGTVGSPCASIQYAYATEAADNDTILVGPGTYTECLNLSAPFIQAGAAQRSINLLADSFDAGDPGTRSLTVIDGNGLCGGDSVVQFGGADSSIEGFTITGGTASGVFPIGGATITNNIITGNASSGGGGIYLYPKACYYGTTNTLVSGNLIENNSVVELGGFDLSGRGGGVFVRARSESFRAGDPILGDGCIGGAPNVTVQNNEIVDNTAEYDGGGVYMFTNTEELFSSEIVITQNTITGNHAGQTTPTETVGFGGGIYATTYGFGSERLEISDNSLLLNVATGYGGGMFARASAYVYATHELEVDDNTVTQNSGAPGGGGLIAMSVLDLESDQSVAVRVTNNLVSGNSATVPGETGGAGGLGLEIYSRRTVAPGATFLVEDNTIRGNNADLDGGGTEIYLTAESENLNDPADTLIAPSIVSLDFRSNLVILNNVTNSFGDGVGGGVMAFTQAFGGEPGSGGDDSSATINFELNTVADNSSDSGAGGIELESYTGFDSGGSEGSAAFNVESSIVADNTGFGFGGPGPGNAGVFTPGVTGTPPDTAEFLVSVSYSDVFGNTTNYEGWVGDRTDTPGAFNLSADPSLDSITYVPAACSPTLDGASPLVDFSLEPDPDGGRANMGHTGGTALAAASLADPNGDASVDGVDVLRVAVAFGSMFGQPRWDDTADLDGSGLVDGDDLAFLAAGFGDVCP